MNKKIEIIVVGKTSESVRFKVHNSQREDQFGDDGNDFVASNKLRIASVASPEYHNDTDTFYVQGDCENMDDFVLTARVKDFDKILVAVQEYNDYFANVHADTKENVWNKISMSLKLQILDDGSFNGDCFISPLVIACQWQDLPKNIRTLMNERIGRLRNAQE